MIDNEVANRVPEEARGKMTDSRIQVHVAGKRGFRFRFAQRDASSVRVCVCVCVCNRDLARSSLTALSKDRARCELRSVTPGNVT